MRVSILGMLLIGWAVGGTFAAADEKPAKDGAAGEKPAAKKDGAEKPGAREEDGALRAQVKSVDLAKGVITVVISGDGGTTVRTFSLAGKNIQVTGVTDKLTDLREGLQVYLKLSADDDVLAIRTAKAVRNSKAGRIFAAYDKSGDEKVAFEEWCAMKEGAFDAARKARERFYFDTADTNKDGTVSFPEFENWLENRGRQPEAPPARNLNNPLPKKEG